MIGDGNRATAGAEGGFGSVRNGVVAADGAYTHHIERVGLQVGEGIAVAIDFYAIFGGIYHIMISIIGIGDRDVS